jgi:hypothetical protein
MEGIAMEDVGMLVLFGLHKNITAIWYFMWPFDISRCYLVYFPPFLAWCTKKNLAIQRKKILHVAF